MRPRAAAGSPADAQRCVAQRFFRRTRDGAAHRQLVRRISQRAGGPRRRRPPVPAPPRGDTEARALMAVALDESFALVGRQPAPRILVEQLVLDAAQRLEHLLAVEEADLEPFALLVRNLPQQVGAHLVVAHSGVSRYGCG